MSRLSMQGKRIYPDENGWLPPSMKPGEYGYQTCEDVKDEPRLGWWMICSPDGNIGTLDPSSRTIIEHEDGTLTVTPSLDWSRQIPGGWYGWLEKGFFRSC